MPGEPAEGSLRFRVGAWPGGPCLPRGRPDARSDPRPTSDAPVDGFKLTHSDSHSVSPLYAPQVPAPLLEVLADENSRQVLLKIAYHGPTRWSAVRDDLAMHPQTYQRTLDKLHDRALIRSRARADDPEAPRKGRRQVVELEATKLGAFLVAVWEALSQDAIRLARENNIDLGLLQEP